MKALALFAVLALAAGTCSRRPAPAPQPTHAAPADPAACPQVCAHYRTLGCPAGAPTLGGASCETVCGEVVSSGLVHWNLGCRATALSCATAEACERP